jgi:hypothetical protein
MVGGWGKADVESMMRNAHQAAAKDLVEAWTETGLVDRIVVATDDPNLADDMSGLPVEIDLDRPGVPFHFGQRLAGLIKRFDVGRALYSGGASAPLMDPSLWVEALSRLTESDQLVVTNNVHSCDWVGFTPASELLSLLAHQTSDNSVAWGLANDGSLDAWSSAPSAATRLDLDTPADLMMAFHHPRIGRHLRTFLDGLDLDLARVDAILDEMARDGGSLALAGRASPAVWDAMDRATMCWVRVFAEERGMRASGRMERGEVRSLLADYVAYAGFDGLFDTLAGMVNGVLLDDRVLLAAQGLWPQAADRYNSDLYRWDEVAEPTLRALTRAAAECRVPVVLGGHSVVAGGLMALLEVHQMRRDGD